MLNSSTWWIADWLIYGETAFPERYREGIHRTALCYQTLRNYAWVARRYEMSRRRDSLTFSHHAEVASLEQPEQDYWLRKAEEYSWSRNELRVQVRASLSERASRSDRGTVNSDNPISVPDCGSSANEVTFDGSEVVALRVSTDMLKSYVAAAARQRMKLQEWIIRVLQEAI
jgi:hypothetical protein